VQIAWILAWLRAFALTVAIEAPIATWLTKPAEPSLLRRAVLASFAQLASHPCVWFVFAYLPLPRWEVNITLAETWAFASETVFYVFALKGLGWKRAALTSLAANAASFGIGLLLEPWLTP
jgi:hypothetical protein